MPTGDTTRQAVAGYFAGGDGAFDRDTIEKILFSSDTNSVLSAVLTTASLWHTGYANSGVAGYVNGGEDATAPYLSRVDKLAFPAETKSATTALGGPREQANGFANFAVAGYVAGGFSGAATLTTVSKNSFPSDTVTTTTSLTNSHQSGAGFANTGVAGYIASGTDGTNRINTVEKLTFPSDTRSTLAATVTTAAQFMGSGFSNQAVAGYSAGGADVSSQISTVDKFAYATDTKSVTTSLSEIADLSFAMSNSGVAGYVALGRTTTTSRNVDKFSFPSDTLTTLTNKLTTARRRGSGFSDEGVF